MPTPNKKNKNTTKAQVRSLERLPSDNLPTIYSNNTQIEVSTWDIRLKFGEILSASPQKITVRSLVDIVMSPQHAKALTVLMVNAIKEYETNCGKIPQPK